MGNKSKIVALMIGFPVAIVVFGCIATLLAKGKNVDATEVPKGSLVVNETDELPLNVYAGNERTLYGTITPGELRASVMGGVFYDATLTNGWTLKIGSGSVLELYDENHNLIIMTSVWELSTK